MTNNTRPFYAQWQPRFRRLNYLGSLVTAAMAMSLNLVSATVDLGAICLQATNDNTSVSGTLYTLSGDVLIGLTPDDGEDFRPLIQISEGSILVDTSDTTAFTVQPPYTVHAIADDASTTLLIGSNSEVNPKSWLVDDLVTGGHTLESGETLTAHLYDIAATEIRFKNPNGGDTTDAGLQVSGDGTFVGGSGSLALGTSIHVTYDSNLATSLGNISTNGIRDGTLDLYGLEVNDFYLNTFRHNVSATYPDSNLTGVIDKVQGFVDLIIEGEIIGAYIWDFNEIADPVLYGGVNYIDDELYSITLEIYDPTFTLGGYYFETPNDVFDGVALNYNIDAQTYELVGNVYVDGTLQTFGDGGSASLILGLDNNGVMAVQSVTLAPAGDLTYYGVTFSSDQLTFIENSDGTHSASGISTVSYDNQSFDLQIGPGGLVTALNNSGEWVLNSLLAEINSDFELYGTDYTVDPANPLTFLFDTDSQAYKLYGDATLEVTGSSTPVSLGTALDPGLVISNGSLQSHYFTIATSGAFTSNGITITPDSSGLTFNYSSDGNDYGTSGGATISFDGQSFAVTFINDGLEFTVENNGTLAIASLIAEVTADLELYGLVMTAEEDAPLTFLYDSNQSLYQLYGDAEINMGQTSLTINLGDSEMPGLSLSNGTLESFNFGIKTNAAIAMTGLNITPNDEGLAVAYAADDDTYSATGGATIAFNSQSISVDFTGDNGLLLEADDGGALILDSIDAELTADLSIDGLDFALKTNHPFVFIYNAEDALYEFYGTSILTIAGETFTIDLGDADMPGLLLVDGAINAFSAGVTTNFEFGGIKFALGGTNAMTIFYDANGDTYGLYGDASTKLGSTEVDVGLGDANAPGILISGGILTGLNFNVSSNTDFTLDDIVITPNNDGLTFTYSANDGTYTALGGATVTFLDSSIEVLMETEDGGPGLVLGVNNHGDLFLISLNSEVTADFTLAGMMFSTDPNIGLRFIYDSDGDLFEFYGVANLDLGNDLYEVDFGDEETPGIEVVDGDVTGISLTIISDNTLSFYGLTITPDENGLGFTYSEDAGIYSVMGGATVSFEDQSFTVSLATAGGDAGLILDSSGNLVSLDAQVGANFEIYGATFSVDEENPLTFIFDSNAIEYILYGSAMLDFHNGSDTEEIAVILGNVDEPGIAIHDGTLSSFNFGIEANLTYDGVTIEIGNESEAFTFIYDPVEGLYESYGEVNVSYEATSTVFDSILGEADNPGIVLSTTDSSELTLEALNASISGSFHVDGLDFDVDALTMIYSQDTDYYEIDGTVSVAIEGNMVSATFGYEVEEDDGSITVYPGMQIQDGDLIGLDFLIIESFEIAGITMETTDDGIGFSHSGISLFYMAFGGVKFGFDDQFIEFDAGSYESPGIVMQSFDDSGLGLSFLLVSLVGNLNFYGVELVPDDVTFNYSSIAPAHYHYAPDYFEFYGDVTVGVDGVEVSAFLGDSDNPGFAFVDGELENLDLGISESIDLAGLTVETTGDYLGFSYNEESEAYEVFGGLSVTFEGQSMGIQAGTTHAPGMRLIGNHNKHMVLKYLDATVTADFSLYGLDVNLGHDGVTFIYNDDDNLYEVYGDVEVDIEGQKIEGLFGNADTPGFEIENGVVESVDIGITTDFNIGGFEFKSPDDNPLTFIYTKENTTYTIYGEAELDTLWDVIITLGSEENPGIQIIDNTWDIENLAIEVDKINLGFAQLKEVRVSYSRDHSDIIVDVILDVIIPEFEGEFDSEVAVDNGKITDIFLEYKAVGTSTGIEILDTGVDIAEMSVAFDNLDQPADLIFEGTIGLQFGGQIGIGGQAATLSYIEGDVYVDSEELIISDTVYFGAYEINGEWDSLIYKSGAAMTLDWADEKYLLESSLYMPADYGIKLTEDLFFSKEYVVLEAKAEVRVPDGIPIIGGDDLGNIDVDLLIDTNDPSNSFAAAWVDIDLLFTTEQAGIEYTFDNGKFKYIDSGDIADIKQEIQEAEDAQNGDEDYTTKTFTFDLPEGATSFMVDMGWALYEAIPVGEDMDPVTAPVGDMFVTVTGTVKDSSGAINDDVPLSIHEVSYNDGSYTADTSNTSIGYYSLPLIVTDSYGVKIASEGVILTSNTSDQLIAFDALAEGTITVSLTYLATIDNFLTPLIFDDPSMTVYYDYEDPYINIDSIDLNASNSDTIGDTTYIFSGTTLPITLEYYSDAAFVNNTTVSIFIDDNDEDHDGTAIKAFEDYQYAGDDVPINHSVHWLIENISEEPSDEYYIYAQIDNGNQEIVYSEYFGPFTIAPAVYGRVFDSIQGNSPLNGFRVYLDVNGDKEYDASIDKSTITNSNGNYVFDDVPNGEVTIGVVIPYGYASNENTLDFITTTYITGDSVEIDFDINLLDSISGYVYEDTNEDGIFDNDEVGIRGVQLFIDQNGNGTYESHTDIKTVTNKNGFWRFYDVEVNTTYDVYILAYPSQISNSDKNFVIVNTTTETIPDEPDSLVATNASVASSEFSVAPRVASASLDASTTSTTKYTEFNGYDFGITPNAVDQVSDRNYMLYILSYFPDGEPELVGIDSDPDDDGLSNKIEQLLNTDPAVTSGTPVPLVAVGDTISTGGDDVTTILVEYGLIASHVYEIQASTDLTNWVTIDTFRATKTEPVILEIETDLDVESTFIRIEVSD
ncbi:SdrD B-like domain-containing protein [Rubellicoccus peritrichatus]|uniref:SdrD B-like domain-containing protein n=1 Tax=Rubellicoccus peritrichatus TaxID=3080537 RepID=A0AAQ3LIB7_9BACT|nr:SdrD B-like domain-containing protein [Puniceicoccus sp. CR14]WOO42604.1 SdrD B-like domain-containing protein [Puniceicoccus sp. CR14]